MILDVYSRRVIGWAISRSLDRELCLQALKMALQERKPDCAPTTGEVTT